MLKIHNNNFKKYRIPLISAFVVIGGMFLFSYLTYIPIQTFAADSAEEKRTLMNIKYMQQLTTQICNNTKIYKTKQLIDSRDNKSYWVTKLKDGNCWMTQNLDWDGGGNKITSLSSWNMNDTTYAEYYNPGDYYFTDVNSWMKCSEDYKNQTGLAACVGKGWTTVGDAHYHIGNYYSWVAAQKVCPAGWSLPGSTHATNSGSYGYLTNGASGAELRNPPYYFIPGGSIYHYGSGYPNTLEVAGTNGVYWTSGAEGDTSALAANISAYGIGASSYARYAGIPVRCLAYGGSQLIGNDNDDESLWPDPNYPDDPDLMPPHDEEPLDSNQANVAITVSPVISIDATSGMSESIDFTQVAEGDITAKISSNQAYQVLLSTEQSNLEQDPILANFNIPMITTDTEIKAGVNSWGVKKTLSATTGGSAGDDTTLTNTLYSPIGVGSNKVLFYQSAGAETKTLVFPVGISVDSTLPSGTYSTQVTITAVAN